MEYYVLLAILTLNNQGPANMSVAPVQPAAIMAPSTQKASPKARVQDAQAAVAADPARNAPKAAVRVAGNNL